MAVVNRQEFNWGTYQDRQLKVLDRLYVSFNESLKISKDISGKMRNSEDLLYKTANISARTTYALEQLVKGFSSEREWSEFNRNREAETRNIMNNFQSRMSDSFDLIEDTAERIAEDERRSSQERERDAERERSQKEHAIEQLGQLIKEKALDIARTIGQAADNFSQSSNNLIQVTGATGSSVRSTRREILDIIKEVNAETGNYFNSQETYSQMVAVAQQANIGSLEVLEEITRPSLLAYESMDISMTEIATLLGRWNTRYTFNSLSMESLVDNIRQNTAGNQASAELTMKSLDRLNTWLELDADGDTAKLESLAASVSSGVSYLGSLGLDDEAISHYTDTISKILSGDALDTATMVTLNKAGLDTSSALSLANTDPGKLYDLLLKGEASVFEEILSNADRRTWSKVAEAYGYDSEQLVKANNADNLYRDTQSYEEFLNSRSDVTAAESVEDKYVSLQNKIANLLSGVPSYISTMQEKLGIGLTDIASMVIIWKSFKPVLGLVSKAFGGGGALSTIAKLLGLGGSAAGAGAAGGSILAGLSAIALPLAGVAGALAVGGTIYAAIKEVNKTNEKNFKELIDVTNDKSKGKDELMMMTKTAHVDEKTGELSYTYNMSMVDASQFNQEEHLANLEANLVQSNKNRGFLQRLGEVFTGRSADKNYIMQKGWSEFFNSLGVDDRDIVSAYTNAGLVTTDSQRKFMQNNFSKIKSLHDSGIVVQLSGDIDDPANQFSRKDILGYATGTNYINSDQIAYLHEGEAVVPKKYNPSANLNELEVLREQSKDSHLKQSKEREESLNYIKETASVLSDIKDFLAVWKDDNIKRENMAKASSKFDYNASYIASYMAGALR